MKRLAVKRRRLARVRAARASRRRRLQLEAAYHATCYRVFLPAAVVDLAIGQTAPPLVHWLKGQGAGSFALLCADNPRSTRFSERRNRARRRRLLQEVLAGGWPWAHGENRAQAGNWPLEESVLIAGIGKENARRLAGRFGQHAFLWGALDETQGRPRLLWTGDH